MKLLLIAPASGKWRGSGRGRGKGGKTFRFSMLSLLSVAAATPPDIEILIVDEQVDEIPLDARPDLVGITCMTALAPRAFEISDRFRAMGVKTVLGGMHPTFCPDEALAHADAVVLGEAESVWEGLLSDAAEGGLKGFYRADRPADLSALRRPPYRLLNMENYSTRAVQAGRGCEHRCAFCAVSAFHNHRLRMRPVGDVIGEVRDIPERFFLFVDDNLTADREYALELFARLAPLGKRWVTQSTLALAEDPPLLEAAARAGCVGIFAGLETLSADNLGSVGKTCNRVEEYRERIAELHRIGIGVEAGMVFGFDTDGPETFRETLEAMDRLKIDAAQFSILTPLPGTRLYETLRPRIRVRDWGRYDFHHPVFQPARMTMEELQRGHDWITREFYRPRRVAARLARWAARPRGVRVLPYAAAINLAYLKRVRQWGIGAEPETSAAPAHSSPAGYPVARM